MDLPENKRQGILDAIYGQRKIEAIKLVREATGCGLKEAKEFVEKLSDELYKKEPARFKSAPGGKGCLGLLVAGAFLMIAAALVRTFIF